MNPNLCRVALRPRSPFEVFDLTLRFMRERARPVATLVLMLLVPSATLCIGVAWLADFALWTLFVPVLLAPLLQAPMTVLGGRLLFDDEVSATQALLAVLRAPGPLGLAVLAEVMTWLLICVGFGVLLLPGIVWVPETALLERVALPRGVARSLRLATGQAGVAIVAAVARWGLLVWCGIVAELAGQSIVGFVLQLGSPFGQLVYGVATPYVILGILLSHPIYALYRLLLYVDVRTRMEGWDLQVGLRALGLQGVSEDVA